MLQEAAWIIRCPQCGSADVRRSYPQGIRDGIMNMLQQTPLRCRSCRCRFFRHLLEAGEVEIADSGGGQIRQTGSSAARRG